MSPPPPASGGTQLFQLLEVDFWGGKAGEGLPWGWCWGAQHPETGCSLAGPGTCPSPAAVGVGSGCASGAAAASASSVAKPGRGSACSASGREARNSARACGAGAQDQRRSLPLEVRCLPLGNVNLFGAVLHELHVPNRIGSVLLPSHFASVGFPTSFNFLSICLVAAVSGDGSRGSRRNEVFIFRNCRKSSAQGKHNYFRLHAGFRKAKKKYFLNSKCPKTQCREATVQ